MNRKFLLFAIVMIVGAWGNLNAKNDITDRLVNADLSTIQESSGQYGGWNYEWLTAWNTNGDVPVVEFYAGWTNSPQSMTEKTFKFSQTITLPKGSYRLAVNAFYRNGDGDGTNKGRAWIFAKGNNLDKKENVAALTSAGVGGYTGEGDIGKAANAFSRGDFLNEFDFSLSAETEIEIGFQGSFILTKSWCILGPVKLYEYTVSDYLDDYTTKVTEAQGLYNSPMNATVLSELKAAVVDPETFTEASEVIAAIDLLKEKIAAAETSIAIYEKINEYLTFTQSKVSGDFSAVTAKITNGTYVTLEEGIADIKKVRNAILVNGEGTDLTAIIDNNSFEMGNTNYWTVNLANDTGARSTDNNTYRMSDSDGDWLFNTWDNGKGYPITQNIGKLQAGKYTLSAVVASSSGKVFLTINDEHVAEGVTSAQGTGVPVEYTFVLSDETDITIGAVADGGNWYKVDNFQLTKEQLLVKDVAIALDANPLVADQWYYYEVPEAGEYTITAGSALANVAYTTNGDDVVTTTNTSQFSASMTLSAGKYYFKSTTAQTLTFTPLTYTYELGTFTSNPTDGAFVQSIESATFTFADAYTNDPSAAFAILNSDAKALLAKGSETVGEGTLSIADKVLTATFSDVILDPASQYTLTIPAGSVGFAGQVSNEAITLTLNTPSVFDGTYYLYDATAKLFLGRGASWGTQAVVDKYGVPFNWKTDATGVGSVEFIDWTGVYLFETSDGYIFTDNASTGWKFNVVTGGYNLIEKNGTKYTTHNNDVLSFTENSADATVWTFLSKEEHDAIMAAYPADNKTSVATAASISDDLDTYTATLTPVDLTSKIGTATFSNGAGDWTFSKVRNQDGQPAYGTNFAEAWQATGSWTQTVTGLPKGIYKLTVNGFERRRDKATSYTLGEQGYNLVSSYMLANGEQVRLASWFDAAEKNGNSYDPDNTAQAVAKFEAGKYVNELYTYVGDDGTLAITINKPNFIGDCWMLFNNFTLTYYAEPVSVEIGELKYATLYYENLNLEVPEGVTAYVVEDVPDGKTLSLTEVDGVIPAGTGVILNGPANTYTFNVVAEANKTYENMLAGTDTDKTIDAEGYKYYVLTTNKAKDPASVGFYYNVDGGKSVNNKAHKAYLAVPEQSAGANEYLLMNADGIRSILENTYAGNGEVYTISGTKVNGKVLTKGIYIVNGKKVVIK